MNTPEITDAITDAADKAAMEHNATTQDMLDAITIVVAGMIFSNCHPSDRDKAIEEHNQGVRAVLKSMVKKQSPGG